MECPPVRRRTQNAGGGLHRREHEAGKPERSEGQAVDYAIEHSYVRDAVVPGAGKLLTESR